MRFGMHVSIAGGIEKSVGRALALGCDAFQIFVANPRSWQQNRVAAGSVGAFLKARERSGLSPVVVHLTYLPNLASPDQAIYRKSCTHFLREYETAARLGTDFFVLHPGSATDGQPDRGTRRVAEALKRALSKTPDGPDLLLENTAGGGHCLGATPEGLAAIAHGVNAPGKVGVCFDTAHACAAGLALSRPGEMLALRRRYRRAFGYHPIRVIHLNDLRSAPGSRHDRHEHIGEGALGLGGLRNILHTPGLRRLGVILETPILEPGDDQRNLARARELAEGRVGGNSG